MPQEMKIQLFGAQVKAVDAAFTEHKKSHQESGEYQDLKNYIVEIEPQGLNYSITIRPIPTSKLSSDMLIRLKGIYLVRKSDFRCIKATFFGTAGGF